MRTEKTIAASDTKIAGHTSGRIHPGTRAIVGSKRYPVAVPARDAATDPVGLSWLVTVRWTSLLAGAGALAIGRGVLDLRVPVAVGAICLAALAVSNLVLMWLVRRGRTEGTTALAGVFVCADVLLLTGLLLKSGGVLNPASVFYLVEIVLAALVLGRLWTWIVTALSVGGYAALFLGQGDELRAAQSMHPEISLHMRGMWIAFAVTALIIAVLVTRLAVAVERRDRALAILRDRNARATRFAGLTAVVAGAAHELSTPLATMAVAAQELEQSLDRGSASDDLRADARLIRAEIERCRRLLTGMAGRVAEPLGEAPARTAVGDVLSDALSRLGTNDRSRVSVHHDSAPPVVWPSGIVSVALANLLRNALQASPPETGVEVRAGARPDGRIEIAVRDRGPGMSADVLARAGEPFFTTKTQGEGTGLGLFVTRSSIEQLGGALTLTSMPGRGTTATVILPRDVVQDRNAS
jgi:two-component system, sensor histidine kinase RegB